jgi:hypothetical protein
MHHLIRRIMSGDHHALTRPPMAFTRPPIAHHSASPMPPPLASEPPVMSASTTSSPPMMPPFPTVPEKGGFLHGIKFLAESFWWLITAAWTLFKRAPKWLRYLLTIWLVIMLLNSRCSRVTVTNKDSDANPDKRAAADQAVKTTANELAQAVREARKSGNVPDLGKLGADIARNLNNVAPDAAIAGRRLVIVPFARLNAEDLAGRFATDVFTSVYGRLELTHSRDVGLMRQPPPNNDDTLLLARAKAVGCSFVLHAHVTGEGDARALQVHLLAVEDGSEKWSDSFPIVGTEPTTAAEKITANVMPVLPRREQPPRKNNN